MAPLRIPLLCVALLIACGEDGTPGEDTVTPSAGGAGQGGSGTSGQGGSSAGTGGQASSGSAGQPGAGTNSGGSDAGAGGSGAGMGGADAGGSDAGGADAGGTDAGGSSSGGADGGTGGSESGGTGGSEAGGSGGSGQAGSAGQGGAAGGTYLCGTIKCKQNAEYCTIIKSDLPGFPDDAYCTGMPKYCDQFPEPSCACLEKTPCGQFQCDEVPGGGFILTCPGG